MSKIYKAIMIERRVGTLFRKQAKSAGITQSEYLEQLMKGKSLNLITFGKAKGFKVK